MESIIETPEERQGEAPEKRKPGRPKGSKSRKAPEPEVQEAPAQEPEVPEAPAPEVPEATPEAPEEEGNSSPVPKTPVVMKTRKPRAAATPAAVAATPAPNAGEIADALLLAWEGRRSGVREAKKALYSSWM